MRKSLERFSKKKNQKATQKEFSVEKVIKRKGDKLYAKWKGCGNSINSYIDKKIFLYKYVFFPNHILIVKTNKKNLN